MGYSHLLDFFSITYISQSAAHIHVMLNRHNTNVYTPRKVNSVDRFNRYYTVYI